MYIQIHIRTLDVLEFNMSLPLQGSRSIPQISPIRAPFALDLSTLPGSIGNDVHPYRKVPYNRLFCQNRPYNRSKKMPFIALTAGVKKGR
jgi:hypothetical protein